MRTTRCIEALVRDFQPFDWFSAQNVRIQYLVNIARCYVTVPGRFRINNDVRSVLALIETACLIGANLSFEPSFRNSRFEELVQLSRACWIATSPWVSVRPLIGTYKDVVLKFRHGLIQDTAPASQISQPPLLVGALVLGEPRANRVQKHDHDRPHQVNERQSVPINIVWAWAAERRATKEPPIRLPVN